MDIEHLTKSQLVLLGVLVSFVTSIATGIITVSLMQQAPPVVSQTVSRVVQQTIEKAMPASQAAGAGKTVVTEQKTVVEQVDLVPQAIARVTPSLVRISVGTGDAALAAGFGLVLDGKGSIAADSSALGDSAEATLTLADGTSIRAFVRSRDAASGIAYLEAATSSDQKITWTPATLAGDSAALGESVILLSGGSSLKVKSGLVAALVPAGKNGVPAMVQTDIAGATVLPGSPIIDTSGAIVGLSTGVSRTSDSSTFVSVSAIAGG